MNYNELKTAAHGNAVSHGFWNEKPTWEHCMMLVITEASEMVEADRKGRRAKREQFEIAHKNKPWNAPNWDNNLFKSCIKDTLEDEMADVAIRLLDLAGGLEVDFDKLQPARYYRSFEKFTFAENAFSLVKGLTRGAISVQKRIMWGLQYLEMWAAHMGIELEWHINAKMAFNAGREPLHGKKY